MSVTATIVWVCDNCGAREELHEFHKPEGWDARTPWSDGMDFAFIGAGHMPLSFGKAKFRELCLQRCCQFRV